VNFGRFFYFSDKFLSSSLIGLGCHIGANFRSWRVSCSGIISSYSKPFPFLDVGYSVINLARSLKVARFMSSRFLRFLFYVKIGAENYIVKDFFPSWFWDFHSYVTKWIPGLITNFNSVVKTYKQRGWRNFGRFQNVLGSAFFFAGDSVFTGLCSTEARRAKILSIGLSDVDFGYSPFNYTLNINNKSFKVLYYFFKLFVTSVIEGFYIFSSRYFRINYERLSKSSRLFLQNFFSLKYSRSYFFDFLRFRFSVSNFVRPFFRSVFSKSFFFFSNFSSLLRNWIYSFSLPRFYFLMMNPRFHFLASPLTMFYYAAPFRLLASSKKRFQVLKPYMKYFFFRFSSSSPLVPIFRRFRFVRVFPNFVLNKVGFWGFKKLYKRYLRRFKPFLFRNKLLGFSSKSFRFTKRLNKSSHFKKISYFRRSPFTPNVFLQTFSRSFYDSRFRGKYYKKRILISRFRSFEFFKKKNFRF